jgi:hypothetical protein
MDIQGYWNTSGTYDWNDRDMWTGQLLLEEDGWFEGLVVNPYSSYQEHRFIFGVYYPAKRIELYKCAPIGVSSPLVFHGKRDAKGYDGPFEAIGILEGSIPSGISHIITQYVEPVRDSVEEETISLENQIQDYKERRMDAINQEFYDTKVAMRKQLCETILRNMEKGIFYSTEQGIEQQKQLVKTCFHDKQ